MSLIQLYDCAHWRRLADSIIVAAGNGISLTVRRECRIPPARRDFQQGACFARREVPDPGSAGRLPLSRCRVVVGQLRQGYGDSERRASTQSAGPGSSPPAPGKDASRTNGVIHDSVVTLLTVGSTIKEPRERKPERRCRATSTSTDCRAGATRARFAESWSRASDTTYPSCDGGATAVCIHPTASGFHR